MRETDRKRFSAVLMVLPELYGKTLSPMMLDLWWRALWDFDLAAIEQAFTRWVTSTDGGKFAPYPADILLLLKGGNSTDAAMQAWATFERAVRQVGPYRSVVFDDAVVHRVVHDMGGWIRFGASQEDEWPFIGNEFRTRYIGYKRQGALVADYPRTLIGLAEAENGRHGRRNPEGPVLIGDPARAQQVLHGGVDGAKLLTFTMGQAINAIPEAQPD
jgi:hypothetical protein